MEVLSLDRIGVALLAAALTVVVAPTEAAAKRWRHVVHHHHVCRPVQFARTVPPQTARPGPMRYYGGPKSPMWRAPVEN
jgi:hypothetical protein